jgi:SnoaL-like domain
MVHSVTSRAAAPNREKDMKREAYERYIELFNAKDYDGVLGHFAAEFEVVFAGFVFRTPDEVRRLYAFLHSHVEERIFLKSYISTDDMIALEADVRLTGIKSASPDDLARAGLAGLPMPAQGQVITIPQFIHYHLKGGKFVKALCAVFQPPAAA